jgi:hypothetical protein
MYYLDQAVKLNLFVMSRNHQIGIQNSACSSAVIMMTGMLVNQCVNLSQAATDCTH